MCFVWCLWLWIGFIRINSWLFIIHLRLVVAVISLALSLTRLWGALVLSAVSIIIYGVLKNKDFTPHVFIWTCFEYYRLETSRNSYFISLSFSYHHWNLDPTDICRVSCAVKKTLMTFTAVGTPPDIVTVNVIPLK